MVGEFLRESIFFLLTYIFLIVIISTDKYISKKNKRIFNLAIVIGIVLIALDFGELYSQSGSGNVLLRELSSYSGYSLRPFMILCFLQLCSPRYKHYVFAGASVLNFVLYYTSHYTHLCVYFSDDNHFHRGPLASIVFILCALGLINIVANSLIEYHNHRVRRWIIPPACTILIVYSVWQDYDTTDVAYPSHLNKILVIVMFLFYLFYHLALVEKYEEKTIQNQKLQLMVSQIKPHFFFNTITTIQALCNIDPAKASETLGHFASYVRHNINTQSANIIPFAEEMKNVETYVAIEKLRFPNIEVTYDLQVTDFDITTLSIQPLVENAIKYGIRSREHGVVTISTHKNENSVVITIADNGIGFDTTTINKMDDTHIGIRNVKERLQILQNAKMNITSNPEGTTVTITIPWEEN